MSSKHSLSWLTKITQFVILVYRKVTKSEDIFESINLRLGQSTEYPQRKHFKIRPRSRYLKLDTIHIPAVAEKVNIFILQNTGKK